MDSNLVPPFACTKHYHWATIVLGIPENRYNSKSWHESPIRGSSMNISIAKSVYLAKKLCTSELEAIGHTGLGSIELKAFELKMSLSFEKSSKS